MAMWVPWNSVWTQRTIDMVIPASMIKADNSGYDTPTNLVFWLQASPPNEPASIWFSDAELYINPTGTTYTLT